VNLRESDMVNMAVALECDADVYLVADIDRGGAFAHLLGTFECLEARERATLRGFVLNKFRGDPALLGNAMDWLEARTGVPTVAVVPYLRHALPEEDALHHRARFDPEKVNLALVVYPYASNLDEFDALIHEAGVNVVPIRATECLADYAAVLLPGSKNTAESLRHLRTTGLADEITAAARRGTAVFGVCGGLQLLGRHIADPHGLESGDIDGLGLLDVTTTLEREKTTRQRETQTHDGLCIRGYEIHHGQTRAGPLALPHLADGLGWTQGSVTGIALHGIFDDAAYRRRWLTSLGWTERDAGVPDWSTVVDRELDRAASVIVECGWRI
jgi:adenosylcobyric acid synthase